MLSSVILTRFVHLNECGANCFLRRRFCQTRRHLYHHPIEALLAPESRGMLRLRSCRSSGEVPIPMTATNDFHIHTLCTQCLRAGNTTFVGQVTQRKPRIGTSVSSLGRHDVSESVF